MECPICQATFPPTEITAHVNLCLEQDAGGEPSSSTSSSSTTTASTNTNMAMDVVMTPHRPATGSSGGHITTTTTAAAAPMLLDFGDAPPHAAGNSTAVTSASAPLMDWWASPAEEGSSTTATSGLLAPLQPATGASSSSSSSSSSSGTVMVMEGPSSTSSPSSSSSSSSSGVGGGSDAMDTPQMDEGEAELARLQAEALRYWEERRKQEEEDMRLARMLEQQVEEEKQKQAAAAAAASAAATKPPVPTPVSPLKRPHSPINGPEKPEQTTRAFLTDSQLARQLEEEERKREEEDRRLAEELWRKEEEEERERKKRKEWEEELSLVRTQAKTESDEELARAIREREELMRELERLKAEAEAARYTAEVADPHVSVVLTGIDYPERWEPQKAEFQTFDVKKGSEEWNDIANHFINTLGGIGATVTRIERNQNKALWTFYYLRRQQVALRNKKDPNEKYLFHGSRANAYDIILKDGFDHRVAHMGGAIGAGVYFATHASTSTGYVTGGHTKKMIYCRVTLGSVGAGKSGIRRPPEKNGGGLHDSVGQVHGGNGMYVVFDNHQAYPEYTIHYR